jgi:hypothetical protein
MRRIVGAVAGLSLAVFGAGAAPVWAASAPEIRVLSNRADLVSGGDALVQVVPAAGTDPSALKVAVDRTDVTGAFAVRGDGRYLGRLDNLRSGDSIVTATAAGKTARLTITNHPIGGPVISGPQIQPWKCFDGATDAQCNRPVQYEFLYKSTSGGALQSYNPDAPPPDVATTTTDQGKTVPFIVRQETGTIARDQYRIAVLYDPSKPFTATDPQDGFNHKLVITHGFSCDTEYQQAQAPDVLNETALGRGFAVMSHALDNAGHNCNIVTQAESLIMTKERVIDQYGSVRYTIGSGCSGGSLTQQQVANAYPGLYQGITPACSFPDAWSSAMQYVDYQALRRYYENPGGWAPGVAWDPTAIAAVEGHVSPVNAVTFTSVIPSSGDPSRSCPGVPPDQVYDPQTNPKGVRCSFHDYMVNVFGRRPQDGFANRPADNVGIEYGRKALVQGKITPAQFADVNSKVGSFDIDYNPIKQRAAADPPSLARVYRSGAVNQADNLDQVAIIDLRGPDPGAFHDVYRTGTMRARLEREHGTAANQVQWRGQTPIMGDSTYTDASIVAMDGWLSAVEKDTRAIPLAQKILQDKPATLVDRCTDGNGNEQPAATCDATVTPYSDPRLEAGMPRADDTIKCELKPLRRADYAPAVFTDDEWKQLEETFPDGVCDYAKPGVDRVKTQTWQTYQQRDGKVIYGGRALGDPPASGDSACAAARPYARFARTSVNASRRRDARRRLTLHGTAKARKGCGRIVRVQVSVARKSGTRCRHLATNGRLSKLTACGRLRYLRAKGTTRWTFRAQRALPRGTYVLRVRSLDATGKASPVSRKRRTAVTLRLR